MTDDPDAQVRIAAFHALACDRCKGDTCAPGADEVLEPALRHLASDPDAHVRAMAAELAGKFVHTDSRAATALEAALAQDPSPAVRIARRRSREDVPPGAGEWSTLVVMGPVCAGGCRSASPRSVTRTDGNP